MDAANAQPQIMLDGGLKPTLQTVRMLRGFAAVAVVALHVDVILSEPRNGGNDSFQLFGQMGWLGVNCFFILSGFLIVHAHYQDIGNFDTFWRYVRQRATRLYPMYWVVLIIMLISSGLLPLEKSWGFRDLIVAFTLLPVAEYPSLPLKVAWTLLFELRFYLIFSLLLLSRMFGWLFVAVWLLALLYSNAYATVTTWTALGLSDLLNIWNINFFFGMSVFWALRFASRRLAWPIFLTGLALLAIIAANPLTMPQGLASLKFMINTASAFAMIILGAILIERNSDSFRAPALLCTLGDASYSIYLVHSAIVSALSIAGRTLGVNSGWVFCMLVFLFSISVGTIAYIFIERPLISLFRGSVKSRAFFAKAA